jgi:hypothetical protein
MVKAIRFQLNKSGGAHAIDTGLYYILDSRL